MANHRTGLLGSDKLPLTDEQVKEIERAVQGLMIRVNAEDSTRFEQLLGALFNHGYGGCSDSLEIAKKQAGLEAVKQFCGKIEKWAGDPLRELSAAKKFNGDGALYDGALERLNQRPGLPNFNGYEKNIVRQHYLPEDAKSMTEYENNRVNRIGRRAFLAAYYGGLAWSTKWAYGKLNDMGYAKPSPAQLKEIHAMNESWQNDRKIHDLSAQERIPEIQAQLNEALKKQDALVKDLSNAKTERENKGEPSWQKVQSDQEGERSCYSYAVAASGAVLFSSIVIQFIAASTNAITRDGKLTEKEQYNKNNATLRSNVLVAAQNELLNGTDALLSSAAQAYEQQQSRTQK